MEIAYLYAKAAIPAFSNLTIFQHINNWNKHWQELMEGVQSIAGAQVNPAVFDSLKNTMESRL